MTRALLTALVAAGLVACGEQPLDNPTVEVDGELLIGTYDNDAMVFRGVPFAEPPLGELRWRAPQPLQSKVERRETTEFAAACMQTMRILDWYRNLAEDFGASGDHYDDLEISEDCLYLNVWTPTLDVDAKLPVLVWIHGGSNKSGWSYEENYRGHVLAPQGAIVVTIAYRQGAFGFLSHPDLEGADFMANFGLWDIVASLQWIQDNIHLFGGDPGRVTLFGESAGGENILALMMAERSRELFHRGVLQSTANYGLSMGTLEAEQARGAALAELLGAETLDEMRQLPATELLDVYVENFDDYYHSPAVDGQLITESTWTDVQEHAFGSHQLIIGTNSGENYAYLPAETTVDDVIATSVNHPRIGGGRAAEMVANEPDPRRALDRLITADAYVCPSQNVSANRTASGGDAWMYHFTRVREDQGGQMYEAFHGAEYSYIFGVHDSYMATTDIDLELSAIMQQYWINFAATGNPNGEGLPHWPEFERPGPRVQEFGNRVATIDAIEPEMCASFEAWNAGRTAD